VPRQQIEEAVEAFKGEFWQLPPPFSAKKIGGVRAYTLARRHLPVEPKPVRVRVHRLDLERYGEGLVRLSLTCSAGFYVRSLAHDLGQALGCGAFLERLRRTRSGEFSLEDAVPLSVIVAEGTGALARLIPPERLLSRLPCVVLTERGAWRAAHGNGIGEDDVAERVPEEGASPGQERVRLLGPDGMLLGIAEPQHGRLLHPVIVLV
jgi:tRNA pseudouridine55 synthase